MRRIIFIVLAVASCTSTPVLPLTDQDLLHELGRRGWQGHMEKKPEGGWPCKVCGKPSSAIHQFEHELDPTKEPSQP